ncbi:hypothetical protein CBR_g46642 [Chara braunii]|uniref:Uncharacterized protein n=1 Tax=Chara braunii TaxID=69332 RepID=A0A388M102_CHABU|nr:hypothetical protein CBR_g46642 [Chara braunii]|eukprot:GBG88153.1 hypothetical protein CBR_g46642 [Chara braunii]
MKSSIPRLFTARATFLYPSLCASAGGSALRRALMARDIRERFVLLRARIWETFPVFQSLATCRSNQRAIISASAISSVPALFERQFE